MEREISQIEKAFESCFSTLENGDNGQSLLGQEVIQKSKDIFNSELYNNDSISEFWDAIEMATTLLSTFCVRTVGGVGPNQQHTMKRVYRFVSGPLREVVTKIENNGVENLDKIYLDRIEAERTTIEVALSDSDLIEKSRNTI